MGIDEGLHLSHLNLCALETLIRLTCADELDFCHDGASSQVPLRQEPNTVSIVRVQCVLLHPRQKA
jgi:hypothetical protein